MTPAPQTIDENEQWDGSARTPASSIWLAAVLFIVWLSAYLDRNILTLLVPALKKSMALSDVQISLVQGLAFSFVFILAGYPIGRLADQYNRRMILFVGVIGWTVVTIATGFANSFGSLFVARMLAGVGEACMMPASVSLVADCFPPAKRGRVMGLLLGGASLGIALSTLAGGVLLDTFAQVQPFGLKHLQPWQLTYVVIGLPGILVALLLFTIREPQRRSGGRKTDPVAPLGTLIAGRWVMLFSLLGAFGLALAAAFGSGAWLATLMMREFDVKPGHVGLVLGVMHLIIGGLGPPLGGWISDIVSQRYPRVGRFHFVAAVFVLQAIAGLMFLFLRSYPATIAINSISILFSTFLAASALAVLPEAAPQRARGRVMSIYQLVTAIVGMGVGPLSIAMVTDYVFRDEGRVRESMSVVIIATSVAGFLLVRLAASRRRLIAETQT